MKAIIYDLETTGLSYKLHAPHQVCVIMVDGDVVEEYSWRVAPFDGAFLDDEALKIGGVTKEQVMDGIQERTFYKEFTDILNKHVSKYDKKDKFHLIGYNNRGFDDNFLRELWNRQNDKYFGSYFWSDTIDVMVVASDYLCVDRSKLDNFKLSTVAKYLGIEVNEEGLHDAMYDLKLTAKILNHIRAARNEVLLPIPEKTLGDVQKYE